MAGEAPRRTLVADAGASLTDLIAHAATQAIDAEDPRLESALHWARTVRGSTATEEELLELARRRVAAGEITRVCGWRPHDAVALGIGGEGLALLVKRGQPVLFAFAHTAGLPALGFALLARMQRPLYLQMKQRNELSTEPTPIDLVSVIWAAFGLRPFDPPRAAQTFRDLLGSGNAVAVAVDLPGSGEGSLFGHSVSTVDTAARLASLTHTPVVLGVSRLRDDRLELQTSAPFSSRDFASPAGLHRAILETLERALDGDPAQLLTEPFPLVEVVQARNDYVAAARARDAARKDIERAREELNVATAQAEAARRVLLAATSSSDRAAAQAIADRAAEEVEAAQASLTAAHHQQRGLKTRLADMRRLAKGGGPPADDR